MCCVFFYLKIVSFFAAGHLPGNLQRNRFFTGFGFLEARFL
jgi:hypothetical protein